MGLPKAYHEKQRNRTIQSVSPCNGREQDAALRQARRMYAFSADKPFFWPVWAVYACQLSYPVCLLGKCSASEHTIRACQI